MPAAAVGAAELFDFTTIDAGAVAWLLTASALVLLMTPGVALFYGGMVRAPNVLGMLMQGLMATGLVTVVWVVAGFSLAFGGGNGWIGDLGFAGLTNMTRAVPGFTGDRAMVVPPMLFALFQLMIAIIAVALITGATADRWRFGSFVLFVPLWSLLVYAPVAHWFFSRAGWATQWGVLDFAGGLVVHVNSGAAALAMALLLGRRRGWPQEPMPPHNLPLAVLGIGLLWFGWLGLTAGSALRADGVAVSALVATVTAAAASMLAWTAVERVRFGRPTTLGAASGAVAGLVAITPCAGFVTPVSALMIGALAGLTCVTAVAAKLWFRLDDSVDVVGVHLVGGAVGTLVLGLFASTAVNPAGYDGLFTGGGYSLLSRQAVAVVVVGAYSFTMTYAIGKVIDRVRGNRVSARDEQQGLDLSQHGERAYELGEAVRDVRI